MTKSFFRTIAPSLASTIKAWRGLTPFNTHLLSDGKDEVAAFHGFDACNQATQFTCWLLEKNGFNNFQSVGVKKLRDYESHIIHSFLYDVTSPEDNPIIVDPTVRQFFSYPGMDRNLSEISYRDDEKLLEALSRYIRNPCNEAEAVARFEKHLMNEVDPIFFGSKDELTAEVKKLHEMMESAFHFGPVLADEMLKMTMDNWEGGPRSWTKTPKNFEQQVEKAVSSHDEAYALHGKAIQVRAFEALSKVKEKTR